MSKKVADKLLTTIYDYKFNNYPRQQLVSRKIKIIFSADTADKLLTLSADKPLYNNNNKLYINKINSLSAELYIYNNNMLSQFILICQQKSRKKYYVCAQAYARTHTHTRAGAYGFTPNLLTLLTEIGTNININTLSRQQLVSNLSANQKIPQITNC